MGRQYSSSKRFGGDPKSLCRTENEQMAEMKNRAEQVRFMMLMTQIERQERIEYKAMTKAVRQMSAQVEKLNRRRQAVKAKSQLRARACTAPRQENWPTDHQSVFLTELSDPESHSLEHGDFTIRRHQTLPTLGRSDSVMTSLPTLGTSCAHDSRLAEKQSQNKRRAMLEQYFGLNDQKRVNSFLKSQTTFNSGNLIPRSIKDATEREYLRKQTHRSQTPDYMKLTRNKMRYEVLESLNLLHLF